MAMILQATVSYRNTSIAIKSQRGTTRKSVLESITAATATAQEHSIIFHGWITHLTRSCPAAADVRRMGLFCVP